jgi:hypothetical protein
LRGCSIHGVGPPWQHSAGCICGGLIEEMGLCEREGRFPCSMQSVDSIFSKPWPTLAVLRSLPCVAFNINRMFFGSRPEFRFQAFYISHCSCKRQLRGASRAWDNEGYRRKRDWAVNTGTRPLLCGRCLGLRITLPCLFCDRRSVRAFIHTEISDKPIISIYIAFP